MEQITINQIHKDLIELKEEIAELRAFIEEDFELTDNVSEEIDYSRKRPKREFISHEEMRKEFGKNS